jgi:alginate O-acetyltransferase complex protein AlgI
MFGILNIPFSNNETAYYFRSYAFVLIIAAIGATPLVKKIIERFKDRKESRKIINMAEPVMLILLLLLVTAYLVDGSFNPFLYFRF